MTRSSLGRQEIIAISYQRRVACSKKHLVFQESVAERGKRCMMQECINEFVVNARGRSLKTAILVPGARDPWDPLVLKDLAWHLALATPKQGSLWN